MAYFVLTSYDKGLSFNVLNLTPETIQECERMIRWQNWHSGVIVHICKANTICGGRFECVKTGKLIKPHIGVFTLKAWGDFLYKTFGE
jgi:hypothetical protein